MPFPLVVPFALMGVSSAIGAGANLYSQAKQRELYRYQKNAYDRQLADWHRNVPGRKIRYPELSYPGRIRALDTGISQSFASSLGTSSSFVGRSSGATLYRRSYARSLYGRSSGRSSRYL